MSGIINKVKNHKKAAALLVLFLMIIAVFVISGMYLPAAVIMAVSVANELTVRKMNRQKAPFGTYSKIRNADCLVIGDISPKAAQNLSGSDKTVSIYLPGCTLAGAYEVLRHTFSILKEDGGQAMLVVRKKNIDKTGYSPFEISFFHAVTINRLELDNSEYLLRLPILFTPIKSLMILAGTRGVKSATGLCDKEISAFCEERGFTGEILEV